MLVTKDYRTPGLVDFDAITDEIDILMGIKPAPKKRRVIQKEVPDEKRLSKNTIDVKTAIRLNCALSVHGVSRKACELSHFVDKIQRMTRPFPKRHITVDDINISKNKVGDFSDMWGSMICVKRFCHVLHYTRTLKSVAEFDVEKVRFAKAVNDEIDRRGVEHVERPDVCGVKDALLIINDVKGVGRRLSETRMRTLVRAGKIEHFIECSYIRFDREYIGNWAETVWPEIAWSR